LYWDLETRFCEASQRYLPICVSGVALPPEKAQGKKQDTKTFSREKCESTCKHREMRRYRTRRNFVAGQLWRVK
jgi:hypothetical protein